MKNKLFQSIRRIFFSKKVGVFAIRLCIASFLWVINALNRTYTKTIAVPIKYINLPKNKVLSTELPKVIQVDVKATGAKLLFIDYNKNSNEIIIDAGPSIRKNKNKQIVAINTALSIGNLSKLFNTEIELMKVKPDSIYFSFGKSYQKIVPVKPTLLIDFDPLYNYADKVKITPSFVTLYGDSNLISSIDSVNTEKIVLNNLNNTISQKAKIDLPEEIVQRVGLSISEVQLDINVDKFTETQLEIPIETIGVPSNMQLKTFPDKITITVTIGLKEFETLKASQFKAIVDYKNIQNNKSKLPVEIKTTLDNVKITKVSPEKVEFLLKKM